MTPPQHHLTGARRAAALVLAAGVLACPTLSPAQPAAAPSREIDSARVEPLAFAIGRASRAGADYSITASQPATSKLTGQLIRLQVVETTGFERTTHYFTLATGKHKTVAEIDAMLTTIFRRFTTPPPPAPNQELGKIGDLSQGGEVRFVAESPDLLRFDNLRPNEPARASRYHRADIEAFLAALGGTPST